MAPFLKCQELEKSIVGNYYVSGILPGDNDPEMKSHSPELCEKDRLEKISS